MKKKTVEYQVLIKATPFAHGITREIIKMTITALLKLRGVEAVKVTEFGDEPRVL